jgi:maleamate amidohydrolase
MIRDVSGPGRDSDLQPGGRPDSCLAAAPPGEDRDGRGGDGAGSVLGDRQISEMEQGRAVTGWCRTGFGGRVGYGRRPALLVVDVTLGFTDPGSPLGADVGAVVGAVRRLADTARSAAIPVVFTTVAYGQAERIAARLFTQKVPALLTLEAGSAWTHVDPRLDRRPEEPILVKLYASAFFGTPLLSMLVARRVDTLVVTGLTTSGCVRATVVDALQHGFRPIVPREAVGDRNEAAHQANLLDIDAKYGDVVDLDEVLGYFEGIRRRASKRVRRLD